MRTHAWGNQSGMWFSRHSENENPRSKILDFFSILIFLVLVCTIWSFLLPTYQRIYSETARESRSVVFLLLIAPLAEGQIWQQRILFVSFAQSEPFWCEYSHYRQTWILLHWREQVPLSLTLFRYQKKNLSSCWIWSCCHWFSQRL